MQILKNASWIENAKDYGTVCPTFRKKFAIKEEIKSAKLVITALGVYEAAINGEKIGEFVFAPGWTSYDKRLQVQEYDVTKMINSENEICVSVGNGWCVGRLAWADRWGLWSKEKALIAELEINYSDGCTEFISTDETWETAKSAVQFSEIYDGETYDSRVVPGDWEKSAVKAHSKDVLIPQEGEIIKEQEILSAVKLIKTPKGENVIDFGQNLTGYLQFTVGGKTGDTVEISHAEILDYDGNFYTENLRSAKQKISYICNGDFATYKPHFSFQGFRYVRLDKWPTDINLNDFKAIVVHSDMKRTGSFECSNPLVNQLYRNVIWGQKGNFLDVPTDCPQRDERLGWTGDAQAFIRTATYNFDVEKFFVKWLHDLKAEQHEDGGIPHVIPDPLRDGGNSSGWADASVICPWQIYLTYGNKVLLAEQYESMQKWVEYMRGRGKVEELWNNDWHFGDWLNLDNPDVSETPEYKHLIGSAFYANSTSLLIKAGKVLGKDMSEYENLYKRIVKAFQEEFIKDGAMVYQTQTAHVLTLHFGLADNKEKIAADLVKLIVANKNHLATGFLGTPYLLHVLTDNGYSEVAYSLMLQEEFPSWLFPVRMGATTIWERWNGLNEEGLIHDPGMNSYNHYAYGACADWMYGVMAGIQIDEAKPAFSHIIFKPITDARIDYVKASIATKHGLVASQWKRNGDKIDYKFEVPQGCSATVIIDGETHEIGAGIHETHN